MEINLAACLGRFLFFFVFFILRTIFVRSLDTTLHLRLYRIGCVLRLYIACWGPIRVTMIPHVDSDLIADLCVQWSRVFSILWSLLFCSSHFGIQQIVCCVVASRQPCLVASGSFKTQYVLARRMCAAWLVKLQRCRPIRPTRRRRLRSVKSCWHAYRHFPSIVFACGLEPSTTWRPKLLRRCSIRSSVSQQRNWRRQVSSMSQVCSVWKLAWYLQRKRGKRRSSAKPKSWRQNQHAKWSRRFQRPLWKRTS